MCREDRRDSCKAKHGSYRADEQQRLATDFIDHGHRKHREDQIGGTNRNCLQIARYSTDASAREDVVQVIENCVDAGELVECSNRNRKKHRHSVAFLEKSFLAKPLGMSDRVHDLAQALFVIFFPNEFQDRQRLIDSSNLCEPSRAARNSKEHYEEQKRWNGGYA